MDIVLSGSDRQLPGAPGANLELSTRVPVAATGISHGHCLFTRAVPGGLPVIMAPTWNYLPGYRPHRLLLAIVIVYFSGECPAGCRRSKLQPGIVYPGTCGGYR